MRRNLSISLILLLWLAPLAAILPLSDDARLPACCRRHGAHHCAMAGESSQGPQSGSGPSIQAPSRCSQFPSSAPATTAPAFALAAGPAGFPGLLVEMFSARALRPAPRLSYLHAPSDRGPPSSQLA